MAGGAASAAGAGTTESRGAEAPSLSRRDAPSCGIVAWPASVSRGKATCEGPPCTAQSHIVPHGHPVLTNGRALAFAAVGLGHLLGARPRDRRPRPRCDPILSVGMVPVRAGAIRVGEGLPRSSARRARTRSTRTRCGRTTSCRATCARRRRSRRCSRGGRPHPARARSSSTRRRSTCRSSARLQPHGAALARSARRGHRRAPHQGREARALRRSGRARAGAGAEPHRRAPPARRSPSTARTTRSPTRSRRRSCSSSCGGGSARRRSATSAGDASGSEQRREQEASAASATHPLARHSRAAGAGSRGPGHGRCVRSAPHRDLLPAGERPAGHLER